MRTLLLFVASCLFSCSLFAQLPQGYTDNIKKAEEYYDTKDYKKSAEYYSKAFAANGYKGLPDDRYNAACSWALTGNADSSFDQLERIATKGLYSDLSHLTTDRDLVSLYNDKRWEPLIALVKKNKDKKEEGLNKPLVAMLDEIYVEDQKYRRQIGEVQEKYGRGSKELKELWNTIIYKDSINLIKVKGILDQYGWLGPDVVGSTGNNTLFLVIQHSDSSTQRKYLPMMREAVKNNKAQPSALALLEDRVALGLGKKQVYGSQIGMFENGTYYVSPLEDPDNVDQRRASVGLGPLAEYVRNWNITWDVAAYKKQLPEIEKRNNRD